MLIEAHTSLPVGTVRVVNKQFKGPSIAVLGCGYWGEKHVRVLSGLSDVGEVFAVDRDPAVRRKIQTAYPSVTIKEKLEDVLGYVDGAIIVTPPESHAAVAIKVLKAGAHVLIEKPIAMSLNEARNISRVAKAQGVVLMAGHTFEFDPVVKDLRDRIQAGELGKIKYIHCSRLNLGLYRSDVNVLWDLAPHDISIMNYLLDEFPTEARAWGSSFNKLGLIDVAHFQLTFPRTGVVGHGNVSWLNPRKVRQVTVIGTEKMAIIDDVAEERLRLFNHKVEFDTPLMQPNKIAPKLPVRHCRGDVVSPEISMQEPLQIEDQYFVDCILNRRSVAANRESGIAVVAVLEAIDQAMKGERTVSIVKPLNPCD